MKVGSVFVVDSQAAVELRAENLQGQTFQVRNVNEVEVHCSRLFNGRLQNGRPRRFPAEMVQRLLGQSVADSIPSDDVNVETVKAESDAMATVTQAVNSAVNSVTMCNGEGAVEVGQVS